MKFPPPEKENRYLKAHAGILLHGERPEHLHEGEEGVVEVLESQSWAHD